MQQGLAGLAIEDLVPTSDRHSPGGTGNVRALTELPVVIRNRETPRVVHTVYPVQNHWKCSETEVGGSSALDTDSVPSVGVCEARRGTVGWAAVL